MIDTGAMKLTTFTPTDRRVLHLQACTIKPQDNGVPNGLRIGDQGQV
jgi:hypothetical protein